MSTGNMRENHLCRVAGNTVWSHYDKWSHERIRGIAHYYALYKSTYTLL